MSARHHAYARYAILLAVAWVVGWVSLFITMTVSNNNWVLWFVWLTIYMWAGVRYTRWARRVTGLPALGRSGRTSDRS